MSAVSMLKQGSLYVDDRLWTPQHAALLRRAASYPEVERILVHPGIKKKLCDTTTGDRRWLQKIRPFWGHHYHFHIRIGCPAGSNGCRPQQATAPGDGCDKSLAWWFTDEPWRPAKGPEKPKARDIMTMKSLPPACQAALEAPSPANEAVVTISGPGGRTLADMGAAPSAASAFAPTPRAAAVPLPMPRPRD